MEIKNPTQEEKILKVLQDNYGQWVSGSYMLHTMLLSQYHARIFSLQKKGYNIEASEHTDKYNFKFYRLVSDKVQLTLFKEESQKEKLDKLMCRYN